MPPAFRESLVSFFRRDGAAAFRKILRYGCSARAWRWFLQMQRDKRLLKETNLLDPVWYAAEYPDVGARGIDPWMDFLVPDHLRNRMPNPDFVPREYEAENLDVKASGVPAALHYARIGMREGRPVSTLEEAPPSFPDGTAAFRREYPAAPRRHRRTVLFAAYTPDGRIRETALHLLRGLREVADDIAFVCNAPVFPEEAAKLEGLVRLAVFGHHGRYDFGSWQIGWTEAKALGLLGPEACDEAILCNDSCFGPVHPFPEAFAEMARRNEEADPNARFSFWGLTQHVLFGRRHVQSYFFVFGPDILEDGALDRFFEEPPPCHNRGEVVCLCETRLTGYLAGAGFRFDTLVPPSFSAKHPGPPIKYPVSTLSEYPMPLVKAKTLRGESMENLPEAFRLVREAAPDLAALLPAPPEQTDLEARRLRVPELPRAARLAWPDTMERTASSLRARAASGAPLRAIFLRSPDRPFAGRKAFLAMRDDPAFDPFLAAAPAFGDEPDAAALAAVRAVRAALASDPEIPAGRVLPSGRGDSGAWPDPLADADVAVWDDASGRSDFRFNPRHAIGLPVLPVLLVPAPAPGAAPTPEGEWGRPSLAWFWKIVFADAGDFARYAERSALRGANAALAEDGDAAAELLRILRKTFSIA